MGEDGDVQDDVDGVADLLAKRDLLTFSASLRNFAEAAKAVQDMRQLRVSICKLIAPPQPTLLHRVRGDTFAISSS